jgi:hypothetical protein
MVGKNLGRKSNSSGEQPKSNGKNIVLVKGLILPVGMDWDFNVKSVMISTDQEEEYLIVRDSKGQELFDYIREPARIKGLLIDKGDGVKEIEVINYEILDE